MFDNGWLARQPHGRAIVVTDHGTEALQRTLGYPEEADVPSLSMIRVQTLESYPGYPVDDPLRDVPSTPRSPMVRRTLRFRGAFVAVSRVGAMYEQRDSEHPLVRCVWRASGDVDGEFTDVANEYWGLGFTRHSDGRLSAEIAGPSTQARRLGWFAGDEYWGADLECHVFWRGLDKLALYGALCPLPVDGRYVELGGVRYPIPPYDKLEALVISMSAQGVLVGDPLVAQALAGNLPALSERSLQRRFRTAAGLGRKQIEQVRRARHAYELLQRGRPLASAAVEAGYADQAHMTRALRVLAGQTPRQILLGG